ncbi:hypothetical protein [Muricoccus vinaceus]|uniref:Uncharacterized protein n=1 Tax=Muricoccus vinaceus TaxID=424704 RepID=A0ABV6IZQ1_9PROT
MTTTRLTALRLLGGALAEASPDQLSRVVSVIDALPDRAEADQVLERVRTRLRGRGLPRPLRFARLLFAPLDGLIVSAQAWRPGNVAVPRQAIPVLARVVRLALGEAGAEIEAECAGRRREDAAVVLALGRRLWPAAAGCLPEAPPQSWPETGLCRADYAPIRARCGAAWRHGPGLWLALQAGPEGPPHALAREALSGPVAEDALAAEVALRLLLAVAARPAGVAAAALELATDAGHSVIQVVQRALDDTLAAAVIQAEAPVPADAGEQATLAAAQAACTLVEDLESSPLLRSPPRQEKLLALRRAADASCRASFSRLLSARLLEPIASPRAGEAAAMEETEKAARALRRIEASGRRLGGAELYDAALRSAAEAVMAAAGQHSTLARVDALRLAEILVGSDAAERLGSAGLPRLH